MPYQLKTGRYAHRDCYDARWALADVRYTLPVVTTICAEEPNRSGRYAYPRRARCWCCTLPLAKPSPAIGWQD